LEYKDHPPPTIHVHMYTRTYMYCTYTHACMRIYRELIASHPANLETVLRGVVGNELGQLRSPSNMAIIAMTVHTWPDEAAKVTNRGFLDLR